MFTDVYKHVENICLLSTNPQANIIYTFYQHEKYRYPQVIHKLFITLCILHILWLFLKRNGG